MATLAQHGSNFSGQYSVTGSLHQGNIVNNYKTADSCLQDLYVTDPHEDKKRSQETKGGLLADSYYWVFDNAEFCQWRDNDEQRLLWVKGDPGKGKMMLICGIIDKLEEEFAEEAKRAPARQTPLSYFFCQATDNRINSATSVLRGLIYNICIQDASLLSYVEKKYKTSGKALFEDANAWHALQGIFTDMLEDSKLHGVYLVVDALDECVIDRPLLLRLILQTSKSSHARWLIASRNWPEIERQLSDVPHRLSLELNAESVAKAVDSYITWRVSRLTREKGYSESTARDVHQYLSDNAKGTFLWVSLVCEELGSAFEWEAVEVAVIFPPGLGPLYLRMITQISQLPARHRAVCVSVLALVATAYRPLSLGESTAFIQQWQPSNLQQVRDVIGLCGSILTVRGETIYFIHQSAKDFLIEEQASIMFPEGQVAVHGHILTQSIEAMSKQLKKDIYQLGHPGFPIEDVHKLRPHPDPLAVISYSCVYWIDHLMNAVTAPHMKGSIQDDGSVYKFMSAKILYWFEALSVLRSVSEGMLSLIKLQHHLHVLKDRTGASRLQALCKDAYRLLQTFRPAIESCPLQTYASMLVFSPTQSLIRSMFRHEEPSWVRCKPELPEQWSACEATLEGHTDQVNSAIFSPDGQHIASASEDKTIKIWNVATGTCTVTLTGHDGGVESASFSLDGQHIVSASDDKTVKLWNATTGLCHKTLKGHTTKVNSATFSPDGQHVVSASAGRSVRRWNVATGACTGLLMGHDCAVQSVFFSPDGQYLVSASSDNTVKLWNATTGMCYKTLEGHTDQVHSATFSPDGQHILSASDDFTVRLWDVATGVCHTMLEGHTGPVSSASFSPDRRCVVSASGDGTLKTWNPDTATCEATLEDYPFPVNSVAISPDGQRFVSASNDWTIKLWNATTVANKTKLDDHESLIWSVIFSKDGRYCASASADKLVKLWDTQTGKCSATLKGHEGVVYEAEFSADGQRIVTASQDNTVRLWNARTGTCAATLRHHTGLVSSVAFSSDGHFVVVSGADDNTVRLWDAVIGKCKAILEGHKKPIYSVAFSSDGQFIISLSEEDTIRLWDARTGKCEATYDLYFDEHFDFGNRLKASDVARVICVEKTIPQELGLRSLQLAQQRYSIVNPNLD